MSIIAQYEKIWRRQYAVRKGFTKQLEKLIISILDDEANGAPYHLVTSRPKKIGSFVDKCIRKGYAVEDLPDIMNDFCGVRIITYYTDQVDKISDLVDAEFEILPESEDKRKTIGYNVFDYVSFHKIAKLSKKYIDNEEWTSFSDFKFEIQIRTLLQHAWADRSHELQYKKDFDSEAHEFKRPLSRLAAIIEFIDDEFLRIRNDIYKKEKSAISHYDVFQKTDLTLDELNKFVSTSPTINNIVNHAKEKGYNITDSFRNNFLYPIISISSRLGIYNVYDLERHFSKNEERLLLIFERFMENWRGKSYPKDSLLNMLLLLLSKDEIDIDLETKGWKESFRNLISRTASDIS